ncbi:MAG: GTP cyclohydrolase, FolE2/MptA family [Fervidicoccaceae archaeon]
MSFKQASPDIHEDPPAYPLDINRAGIRSLYIPISLEWDSSCLDVSGRLSVLISLPGSKKGVHIARLVSNVLETFDEKCMRIENALSRIAARALSSHPDSNSAEIKIIFSVPKDGQEIPIRLGVTRKRTGEERWHLAVSMKGTISCPCAKEVFKFYEKTDWNVTPTHMQRALAEVKVESHKNSMSLENAMELIDLISQSFSGKLQVYLSRDEEERLIKKIINTPLFAEDLARKIGWQLAKSSISLKADWISVRVTSFESIHPFNVYGEVMIDGEELRNRSWYKEL